MSLNFPTAFWKDSNPSDSNDGVDIDWNLYLYYSTNGNIGASQVTSSSAPSFSEITSAHPYTVEGQDYYPTYRETTTSNESKAFFGWLLAGYDQNDLSDFHRANPWILDNNGKELNLFFESDQGTLEELVEENRIENNYGTEDNPRSSKNTFNKFIQSGYAEGSFTLASDSNLSITVSGLGERNQTDFEKMHLAVDDVHICKGQSPGDSTTTGEWDMNQVKLFNSDGNQTPDPAPPRAGGIYVDQDNRRFGYTTAGGQATFTPDNTLGAGEHTIKIYFNTNDGVYNSGAFYGFKFNFS